LQYLPTDAIDIARIPILGKQVAKINDLEKMPYAELADMEVRIDKLRIKMRSEMQCARRLVGLAKEHDLDIHDPFGKGPEGTVAVTYRDPRAPRTPGRDAADTALDGCATKGAKPARKISSSGDLRCGNGP
jgi:hypothetical protein